MPSKSKPVQNLPENRLDSVIKNKKQGTGTPRTSRPAAALLDNANNLAEAETALFFSDEVSLSIRTTALTPWSPPVSCVGTLTDNCSIKQYLRNYECAISTLPRVRILSFSTPDSRFFCFDFDTLNPDEKTTLVTALHGKNWIGHNLAYELVWLQSICSGVMPCRMIDTFLLTITHVPEFELFVRDALHGGDAYVRNGNAGWGLSAIKDDPIALSAMADHLGKEGQRESGASLAFLSLSLLRRVMPKGFDKPISWTPSRLSIQHRSACSESVIHPPMVVRMLLGLPVDATTDALREAIRIHPGARAYVTMTRAIPVLVRMQRNGLRMDREATLQYRCKYREEAEISLDKVIVEMPEITAYRENILDGGQSDEFKSVFAGALTRLTGKHPGVSDTGMPRLDSKHLKMTYRGLPVLDMYRSATAMARRAAMAKAYIAQVDHKSRLHAMISVLAVTGRTTSQEPNLQGAPADQDFRALFTARPGYKILSVDYRAIEMRIAAALTVRSYRVLRSIVDAAARNDVEVFESGSAAANLSWVLGRIGRGHLIDKLVYLVRHQSHDATATLDRVTQPDFETSKPSDWLDYYAANFYQACAKMWAAGAFQRDPADDVLTLPKVFKDGLDPHLITSVATETRAGRFDTGGCHPLQYIKALPDESVKGLMTQLKTPRQSAKAQNFGLLYGMAAVLLHAYGSTEYDLDWTLLDAEVSRDAWFDLFPEVLLWHLMTRFGNQKTVEGKVYRSNTLSGRPVASDRMPAALNFQDQGTGAEIALSAMSDLSGELQDCLVNFVHDEFVFEIPDAATERLSKEVSATMIRAADRVLLPFGIQTEVEASVGDYWIH